VKTYHIVRYGINSSFRVHQQRHDDDRQWLYERAKLIAVNDVERELVMASIYSQEETARTDAEIKREVSKNCCHLIYGFLIPIAWLER
jgi:FKBP-type peptidyl-prolyl cis-trans isomerase (trigger factor)